MSDRSNPYTPGQPVTDPDLFVGRRDLLASIRENLVKGRRVFIVSGAPRMGKTSLLRQIPAHLPQGHTPVYVDLKQQGAQRLDWLLWRVADAIGREAGAELGVTYQAPAWGDFQDHPEFLSSRYWPQVRALLGDRRLLLMLDDVECLGPQGSNLLEGAASALADWRDLDESVSIVVATGVPQQEALRRDYPRLFGGALTYVLAPLSSEEAMRLITGPVEGVLSYDFGVPRRLVEATSGQPYYLQLLCSEVYGRCAASGWVNQRDLDLVIEALIRQDIAEFRQAWDDSTPQEQASLAGLVNLRGARGVATVREVHDILAKAGARPGLEQVRLALDRLTERGILEQLGALSYRFRVALLRDWLAQRADVREVARSVRWPAQSRSGPPPGRTGRGLAPRARPKEQPRPGVAPVAAASGAQQQVQAKEGEPPKAAPPHRRWLWPAAVGAVTVILIVTVSLGLSRFGTGEPTATQRAEVSPTKRLPTLAPIAASTRSAATTVAAPNTPRPRPPATPSPTAPIIVARSVPSIAYLSRTAKGQPWTIYVMNSDGSNRIPLIEEPAEFLSAPSWSPDGSRIAFVSDRDGNADIWVMDSNGRNAVNLTRNKAKDQSPSWSPDGEWIAFASVRESLYYELYMMRPDGSGVQRLTWWEDASDLSPSWSPDGSSALDAVASGEQGEAVQIAPTSGSALQGMRLAFASKRDGNWEIYVMDLDGSNLLRLTDNPADDTSPAWSPDGSRIAFQSTRDGYSDIYVMPVAGGEVVNLTKLRWATDLGATWSPDGSRLAFYSDRDGEWDIYVMNSDGSNVVKLTADNTNDQLPAWRP